MESVIKFEKSKAELFKSFGCKDEYFIKGLEEYNWKIKNDDGWYIVSYWKDGMEDKKTDIVIVKKNGEAQIFNSVNYTMIIGIQCVKIAFIFKNSKQQRDI